MKTTTKPSTWYCLKAVHLVYGLSIFLTASLWANAPIKNTKTDELPTIQMRSPASTVPDDEMTSQPLTERVWLESFFVEDDEGVLRGMKNYLNENEKKEEFVKNWRLESTGVYEYASKKDKEKYINRQILKYADRRLTGEVKSAEKGSTWEKIGSAEKTLRPNTQVEISKDYSIKFKARLLQGKAFMELKNPYMEQVTTLHLNGKVTMLTRKQFKDLGIETAAEYTVNNNMWEARLDKNLTENLKGRISSSQSADQMFFTNDADKKVEMIYNTSF